MYMYSILLFYCFLLKILSTNTVGDHSVPSRKRLVAFFGRFSMIFRETFSFSVFLSFSGPGLWSASAAAPERVQRAAMVCAICLAGPVRPVTLPCGGAHTSAGSLTGASARRPLRVGSAGRASAACRSSSARSAATRRSPCCGASSSGRARRGGGAPGWSGRRTAPRGRGWCARAGFPVGALF